MGNRRLVRTTDIGWFTARTAVTVLRQLRPDESGDVVHAQCSDRLIVVDTNGSEDLRAVLRMLSELGHAGLLASDHHGERT